MMMLVLIMWYAIALCQPVGWLAKMSYKKMLRIARYCCQTYNICWSGWHVGQACTSGYLYANLSGFLLICPDLVPLVSPSCIIVLLSFIMSVHVCLLLFLASELCYSLSFASSFCFLSDCPRIFVVCMVAYATGFLVMLFSISANGSALMFCCFVE